MSDPAPESPGPIDWRRLHAYGLPSGTIRALMALVIIGSLWGLLVAFPDREVPESLRDLLFIILGHYFAMRTRHEPGEDPGPPPLFLPRGSVRLLLIAGFVAVAAVYFRQGRLVAAGRNPGVVTLILVFGFLLGVVLQRVAQWLRGEGRRLPRWVEDARATLSLLAAVGLVLLVWDRFSPFLPDTPFGPARNMQLGLGRYGPEHLLAAVVGFYFGSRS